MFCALAGLHFTEARRKWMKSAANIYKCAEHAAVTVPSSCLAGSGGGGEVEGDGEEP